MADATSCSPSGCEPQPGKVVNILGLMGAGLIVLTAMWFTVGLFVAPVSSLMYLYSVGKPAQAKLAQAKLL